MPKKRWSAALGALTFCATQALAANTWKYNLPVESIAAHPNGFTLLLPASDPACGSSGNQFIVQAGVNGQTADGAKMILAVALSAMHTGKTINVIVDTTIAGCPVWQVQINP